jgi:hypothetical protein
LTPGEYVSIGITIGIAIAAVIYEVFGTDRRDLPPTIYCNMCEAHVGLRSWTRHLRGHEKAREIRLWRGAR